MSAIDNYVKSSGVKVSTPTNKKFSFPTSGVDTYINPPPVTNKFGTDVSSHPFNPFNKNSQFVDPYAPRSTAFPQVNPIKEALKPSNLGAAVKNIYQGTGQAIHDIKTNPLSLPNGFSLKKGDFVDDKKLVSDVWNSIKEPVKQEANNLIDLLSNNSTKSVGEQVGIGLKFVSGLANIAFSPISALFAGANDVPILGTISKAITLPFQVLGEGGARVGTDIVEHLPISQETKDQIKPGIQDIFALAYQIFLGKVGADKYTQIKKGLVEKYGLTDAQTILDQAQKMASEKSKAQFPVENPIPKDVLSPKVESTTTAQPKPVASAKSPLIAETPKIATKISKVAKDINTELVSKGFDALSPEEQAKFTPITKKETLSKIGEFITNDLKKAKEAIKTGEVPGNFKAADKQVLFNSMEEHALKTNDYQLLKDLANSPIANELSVTAQTLGASGFNKVEGAVSKIREVQKAREAKLANKNITKLKDTTVKQIKESIKKTHTKQSWSSFVESLRC